MNPQISLNTFIPPSPEFDYVNLLKTHDRHGLNNGVFLIKVNDWSVKLLTAVVSFHHFRPLVELKYSEQSALEEMLKDVGSSFFIQQSSYVRNMLLIIILRHRYVEASSEYHNAGSMRIPHLREKMPFFELMSSVLGACRFISPAIGTASETPAWTPGWILLSSKVQNGYCRQNRAD
jgi:hypothetical protein